MSKGLNRVRLILAVGAYAGLAATAAAQYPGQQQAQPQGQGAGSFQIATAPGIAPHAGTVKFVPFDLRDENFPNIRMGTIMVPAGWKVMSRTKWDFGSINYPVKTLVRVESPDGKMWVELQPNDAVFWSDAPLRIKPGQRQNGAVFAPNATIQQAMEYLDVGPARGRLPGFAVVSQERINPALLARAFAHPELQGEAQVVRTKYTLNGAPAEEDFYSFYMAPQTLTATGGQGVTHEFHRLLVLNNSIGATDGLLKTAYRLLGMTASSYRVDPAYLRHIAGVQQVLNQQYQAALKAGYDSINAAVALSHSLTAQSNAFLQSVEQTRVAQNAQAARTAEQNMSSADKFDQVIRGTTRYDDPYYGTSDHSSNTSYQWTDGYGNYRGSNDAGFNPNTDAGHQTWQLMQQTR